MNVFGTSPWRKFSPAARKSGTAVIAGFRYLMGCCPITVVVLVPAPPGSVAALGAGWIYLVPDGQGMQAAHEFSGLCRRLGPRHVPPVQIALRWLLDQEGASPASCLTLVVSIGTLQRPVQPGGHHESGDFTAVKSSTTVSIQALRTPALGRTGR